MILEQLFRGNFTPLDLVTPTDPEYETANQKVCDLTDQLREKLSSEDRKLLEDLIAQIYTAQCMESEALFQFGFAAGVRLQAEVAEQMDRMQ